MFISDFTLAPDNIVEFLEFGLQQDDIRWSVASTIMSKAASPFTFDQQCELARVVTEMMDKGASDDDVLAETARLKEEWIAGLPQKMKDVRELLGRALRGECGPEARMACEKAASVQRAIQAGLGG